MIALIDYGVGNLYSVEKAAASASGRRRSFNYKQGRRFGGGRKISFARCRRVRRLHEKS